MFLWVYVYWFVSLWCECLCVCSCLNKFGITVLRMFVNILFPGLHVYFAFLCCERLCRHICCFVYFMDTCLSSLRLEFLCIYSSLSSLYTYFTVLCCESLCRPISSPYTSRIFCFTLVHSECWCTCSSLDFIHTCFKFLKLWEFFWICNALDVFHICNSLLCYENFWAPIILVVHRMVWIFVYFVYMWWMSPVDRSKLCLLNYQSKDTLADLLLFIAIL